MIFLDANLFIAAAVDDDEHHASAVELFKQLRENGERQLTSEYVIGELLTFLARRKGLGRIDAFAAELTSPEIQVLIPEKKDIIPSVEVMKK